MDPLLVITNKDAGTADQETLELALEILRARTSVEVAATSDPGELDGVLQRAGSRRIVVAGGDGSLHAVISALHRRNQLGSAVVALLPLGTGNDFARGVGIPLDIEEAARHRRSTARCAPIDLIVDEVGEIVVNNVHVGAGAQASRKGARWKKRLGSIGVGKLNLGKLGYPIGALQSALHPAELHLRVEVDGKVVNDLDRPVLMVAVGNGANIGGGTEVTPHADPEDGKVDVMVSRAIGPARQARLRAQDGARGLAPRARRRRLLPRARRCRSPARSSTAAPTARSTGRSGSVPGTSSRRRTASCCRPRLSTPTATRTSAYSQPRRAASTPAWNRVSAPSSIIRSATRRRTVRRLSPRVRAICSSLAPAASWRSRLPRRSTRGRPGVEVGQRGRLVPVALEQQGQRADDRRLPDQQPRLVGEPERLGQDAWVPRITSSRVGISSITRTCSPCRARACSTSGASCSARSG